MLIVHVHVHVHADQVEAFQAATLANARAQYAGARAPEDKMRAANAVEGALSRLMVVVENYPNLKADQTFARLMDELV